MALALVLKKGRARKRVQPYMNFTRLNQIVFNMQGFPMNHRLHEEVLKARSSVAQNALLCIKVTTNDDHDANCSGLLNFFVFVLFFFSLRVLMNAFWLPNESRISFCWWIWWGIEIIEAQFWVKKKQKKKHEKITMRIFFSHLHVVWHKLSPKAEARNSPKKYQRRCNKIKRHPLVEICENYLRTFKRK